jgi:Polysaccharide deacetylase
MGGMARRRCRIAAACLLAALGGCARSDDEPTGEPAARTPLPAPHVVLTPEDRRVWAPRPPDRSVVPVLLYSGVALDPKKFARQMTLLDHAGYETITLDEFVRFVRGRAVRLPPRPLLLTFDGGRADSWTGSDGILKELGFRATVFVDVGRVDAHNAEFLTWKELNALQASGRWDVQLQAGTGARQIRYGDGPDEIGPFYAYRGSEERIDGWRERVFSDITWGEEQLSFRVHGYRPLAFAPPYGNYGQAGTNDPRIPRELLARLFDSFDVVFTQDPARRASRGAGTARPLGRIEVTRDVTDEELYDRLDES